MDLQEIALNYIVSIVTENEEVKKFPKDFVTASMQWIRSWFLIDDPIIERIIENPTKSVDVKKELLEEKLQILKDNPLFIKELEAQLAVYQVQRERLKNVVDNSDIDVEGNVHIGDKDAFSGNDFDQKNIVKNSKIKAGGDFRLGDG